MWGIVCQCIFFICLFVFCYLLLLFFACFKTDAQAAVNSATASELNSATASHIVVIQGHRVTEWDMLIAYDIYIDNIKKI